jgi:hypothetical protein
MKPRIRIAGITLALLGLLGTGSWLLLRTFSGPEFVAGALGAVLGRPVEVGSVQLRAGGSLRIEFEDLRILDSDATEPMLRVDRVVARLGWPRLLAGQIIPTAWTLERPVLHISEGNGESPSPRLALRPVQVAVRDGTLVWGDPDNGGVQLTRIELSARAAPLGTTLRGTAMSQIERAGETVGSFSVEFDADTEEIGARGSVTGVDLSRVRIPGLPPIQGQASGTIALRATPKKRKGTFELDVEGLVLDDPSLTAPVAPEETRVVVDLEDDGRVWQIGLRPLQLDDFVLRGVVRIDQNEHGRVSADVSIDPFRPGLPDERLQLTRLVGLRHASWARTDARVEAGRVTSMHARLDVPRAIVSDTLGFRRKPRPHEFQVKATVEKGVYRPKPESQPLENIEAEIRIRGNRLEVYDVRMTHEGKAIPEVDLTIDGLHRLAHLSEEERKTPPGPGVPIPGLGPAFESFASDEEGADEIPLQLRDLRVGYPAFLFPIRDATATLSFPEGNLLIEELEGVIGGAPAKLQALWDRGQSRVVVDVTYLDGEAPEGTNPTDPWFEAMFSRPSAQVGIWKLADIRGQARGLGAKLHVPRMEAHLGGGPLDADGTVDLSREGVAPIEFRFHVEEADANEVAEMITLPPKTLTGKMAASGSLVGPLEPDVPFVKDADMVVDFTVRDGKLGNLPVMVTIARLATPLGWSGLFGGALRFNTLESSLRIEQGTLHVDSFSVDGPELRILAAGQIDLMPDDMPVDLLVALLLLEPVNRLVDTVPLIGDWMLGKDRSLVALYFELKGPWEDPEGDYVPPETLRSATGWAANMIVGGVRRLRDLLLPGRRATP